jgi:hypothetical protein
MTETTAGTAQPHKDQALRFSRLLAPFETCGALMSSTIWLTLCVEGQLDLDKLRAAWELLRQAHPVLTAKIRAGRADPRSALPVFELAVPSKPAPAELVVHKRGRGLAAYPIRQNAPVALVDVVPMPQRAFVSLVVSHAVADGRLAAHLHALLWSYYTELVEGAVPEFDPAPVPKPPEELLAERGFRRVELRPGRAEQAVAVQLPEAPEGDIVRERVQLSPEATERVRACAQKTGGTVHGLVSGAVAVALRQGLALPQDVETSVLLRSPVDLRERLDPPAEVAEGTNVIGFADAVVAARPDSDPVALGGEVTAQIRADLDSGRVHQSTLHIAETFAAQRADILQATITNIGVVREVRAPRGAAATELFGWVAADWAPMRAFLRTRGHNGAAPAMNALHIVSTYRGRLCIDIGVTRTRQEARGTPEGSTDSCSTPPRGPL